jgi:ubiquinone/menaquinone biosynthesis C-methylase UbiE
MNKQKTDSSQVAQSWDAYWRGTGELGAFSSGGVSHPGILAFWDNFFESVKQDYVNPTLLDIASGNGAVIERAFAIFESQALEVSCVDISESAIGNIQSRFPAVHGTVADARSLSFDPGSFDLVSSQFGVEYAGLDAIDEAVRMLAPGGQMALLLHNQVGVIYQECKANLDAISKLQESGFVPLATELFRAGFEAVRGADRAPYDDAGSKLAPAIQTVEDIMKDYGQGIADDTIVRLYSDVSEIHSSIQQYEPGEVLGWLDNMDRELKTYTGRMSSMCEAAIDEPSFEKLCNGLSRHNCEVELAGPLTGPGNDIPLAWALTAKKLVS